MARTKVAFYVAFMAMLMGVNFAYADTDTGLPFTDVPNTHWAYSYIKSLYEDGITNGVQRDCFGVNEPLAARQFIVMLARAEFNDDVEFSESSAWDTPSIEYFNENGFYEGTTYEGKVDNPYAFTSSIKRSDMAKMVYNILKAADKLPIKYSASYSDVYDNIEIYAAISETGILTGYTDGTFKPDKSLTRAEGSVVVKRLVDYLDGEDVKTDNKKNAEAVKMAKNEEAKPQSETNRANVENYLIKNSLEGTSLYGREIKHYIQNYYNIPINYQVLADSGIEIVDDYNFNIHNSAPNNNTTISFDYQFINENGYSIAPVKGTIEIYLYDGRMMNSYSFTTSAEYGYQTVPGSETGGMSFTLVGDNQTVFSNKEDVFYARFISSDGVYDISIPCFYQYNPNMGEGNINLLAEFILKDATEHGMIASETPAYRFYRLAER